MQVKDVMSPEVSLCYPDTTLQDACRMMRDQDIGSLPVASGDRLVGMVTDRDVCIRGVAEGLDPRTATCQQVMTENIRYCFEDESTEEVEQNMADQRVRRLPVLNRSKRLVGIVSLGDLARKEAEKAQVGQTLGEVSQPRGHA